MKKTLLYLQSLVLTTTPILTTISCNKSSKTTNDKVNPPGELSKQEKEIIDNTALFTRLLLLSRHENLNFNSTDLLNAVFAPRTTWNAFSRNYTFNDKTYNLNEYTEKLTSEYSNLARLNASKSNPFLASTLTGMYQDKLYKNYVAQKENKKNDIFGYFDEKNNINADNISSTIQLSTDPNRKQLAWANFTGPLSKYIAEHPIVDYRGHNYGGSDPRAFYGRFLEVALWDDALTSTVITKEDGSSETINLEGLKINTDKANETQEFGKYQTKIFKDQKKANFSAQLLETVPFIQNFNETLTGSIYGLKFLNSFFPFTDSKANMDKSYVVFFLLQMSIVWMKQFADMHRSDKKALAIFNVGKKLNGTIDAIPGHPVTGLFKETDINFIDRATIGGDFDFKVQMLMKKGNKQLELFDTIKNFKDLTFEWVKEWDEDMKTNFLDFFKKEVEKIKSIAKNANESIGAFIEQAMNTLTSPDEVISSFITLGDMMGVFADNQDKFLKIADTKDYNNKDFDTLTKSQQQDIAILLGFKDNKFEEGSVLNQLHKVINNETFNKLILGHESPLYKYNSENVQEIHEKLLQYALDDQYWKVNEKSFKLKGAISGNESLNSKFSYTIEYNGIGDKTVTKFLDQPVELPNNFNPIAPWDTPTNVNKNWSFQDHIDYTGLGNGDFKDVDFKYNVEWSNISDKPDFPYWVITKVDLFRKENNEWKQFYPVM